MMPRSVRSPTWALQPQLEADRTDPLRVLHAQVVVDEPMASATNPAASSSPSPSSVKSGMLRYSAIARSTASVNAGGRSPFGWEQVAQLEGAVHQRAAGGVHGGRIGHPLDVGEAERHRTGRERLDAARRHARGDLERGCVPGGCVERGHRHVTNRTGGVSPGPRTPVAASPAAHPGAQTSSSMPSGSRKNSDHSVPSWWISPMSVPSSTRRSRTASKLASESTAIP